LGESVAYYVYNEFEDECPAELIGLNALGQTALEENWRVGPFSVSKQTLSLKYGSIGDGGERAIEFYAKPNSIEDDNVEANCFDEGGLLQDPALLSSVGFGIDATIMAGETQLAITFDDSIQDFDGYNGGTSKAPTVEFCVKVTVGDKIFRQLAVRYAFTLDGAISIENAVVFNEDGTSEEILVSVVYGINAYLCDAAGVEKDSGEDVIAGQSIFICMASDNEQAYLSSVGDLRLTSGIVSTSSFTEQLVVSTDATNVVEVSNLANGSCADGKCTYEVILDQIMFQAIASGLGGKATISVIGSAQMEFGALGTRRSLKIAPSTEGRSLEEVEGDISGEFEVTAANGAGSSAATCLGGGMLITTSIVAAFNLL